ncbi:MAG: type I restriction enzyme HsdR N-terminal domain-containing protein [Calothrix sp. MO_167.B12]|nr:type I restriction enzyme HsdR N-terminal domain-containing protein [Calothrix sp. MO_167.B12]
MCSLKSEIYQKLDIYQKSGQQYTKCLKRGIEIPINQRPEELVRQIFLHFLMNKSGLFHDNINIEVEANHHDIEIYQKQLNHNFKPHQTPLIIVEVKREDVDLHNHYEQIKRYLKQSRCNIGILYNYHKIIVLTRQGNIWKTNYLKSLREVENFVVPQINIIDNGLSEFEKAQNGNFENFVTLVKKYGKYTTHRIVFKVKHQVSEIEGYLFNIQENKVYYKICGQYGQKYKSFDRQDFDKLISITY